LSLFSSNRSTIIIRRLDYFFKNFQVTAAAEAAMMIVVDIRAEVEAEATVAVVVADMMTVVSCFCIGPEKTQICWLSR
jgi:hypothetical protein